MEIPTISRRRSRSADYGELDHFALLFCRGRQRNKTNNCMRVVHGYSRDAWLADFIFRQTWILKIVPRDLCRTGHFCVTREWLELLTNIRDLTTLLFVISRRESSEWLESSIEGDLGMRFAIRSFDLAFHDFLSWSTRSSVRTGH